MLKEYFTEEEYERLCQSDDLLYKSLEIITRLFKDKTDKSGIPYVVHLFTVYALVFDYKEKCMALLHDVVEDTDVSFDDLRLVGFDDDIIEGLTFLTKCKGEDYGEYIERIISSKNIHVLNVKLADLTHNMDITRIKNPSVNDYDRISKRYLPARERILNALNELN